MNFFCHSIDFLPIHKKVETPLKTIHNRIQLTDGLLKYYSLFEMIILIAFSVEQIHKRKDTCLPPRTLKPEGFGNLKQVNQYIISDWKSIYCSTYEEKCIIAIQKVENILVTIEGLTYISRMVFKASIMGYSDQQIANNLNMDIGRVKEVKEETLANLCDTLEPETLTYFNVLLDVSGFEISPIVN